MPKKSGSNDPYRNFNFRVEWGGAGMGFSEVRLPEARAEVIEYREGNSPVNAVRHLPGLVRYGNVVLKRGITDSQDIYQWWKTVEAGAPERRDVSIALLDENHAPVKVWKLRGAWPVKIDAAPLNAKGNDVAIEEMELVVEGIEIESL